MKNYMILKITTTVKPVYSGHLGTQNTVLIIEVSLFHRFIYTHLYCNGTTTDCPYYRGVLIISECPQ